MKRIYSWRALSFGTKARFGLVLRREGSQMHEAKRFLATRPTTRHGRAMSKKLTPLQIQEFWTEQARSHGLSPCASWSDLGVIELETRESSKYLEQEDSVLGAGCANGF